MRRVMLASAVLAAAVLIVGQLVLPGAADRSLRSRLERHGTVRRVEVRAFPAVALLVHHADRVDVVMGRYRSGGGDQDRSLADFLSDTRAAGELDARVRVLEVGLLRLHGVHLRKDGDELAARARLTRGDLRAALPDFVRVRPLRAGGAGILLRASATALGHTVRVRLRVFADGGRIVVRPESLPFGSLATITVFDDDRVAVESLRATEVPRGYIVRARARLR